MMRAGLRRCSKTPTVSRHKVSTALACTFLVVAALPGAVAHAADWQLAWSAPTSGLWQPATSGELVIGRNGAQVSAFRLSDGKRVWRKTIAGLVTGRYVLAAGKRFVYALAATGMFVLDVRNGEVVRNQPLEGATRLLRASGSVYVSDTNGVKRFDASGKRQLGSTIITGTLERADGDFVVLHRWIPKAKGPNRLSVVSLKDGAVAYEFKLLPAGDHRVAAFDGGHLVFVDHSRFDRGGKRKLYYTEADARSAKKLRDIALSSHFASSENTTVDAVRLPSGKVFIASFGPPGASATLLAYNPAAKKMLWTRSGSFVSGDIALFAGKLWTTLRGSDARTQLVAYDAESGDRRVRVALDNEPAVGAPVSAGQRILLRTRDRLLCFAEGPLQAKAPAPDVAATTSEKARPGWYRVTDAKLGYSMELPDEWRLEERMRKDFGGGRYAIPYATYQTREGRRRYVASVHVLVRPSGNQDVEGLWRTVLGYWRNRATQVKTVRVRRFTVKGKPRIFGVYSFLDKRFNRRQARSLCIVHGGRAYEVRARVGSSAPKGTWRRIAQIMRSFRTL
jgi:outer membrane protein assembly factor BamB